MSNWFNYFQIIIIVAFTLFWVYAILSFLKFCLEIFYNQKLFYLLFARFDKSNPKIPRGWRQLRLGEIIPNDKYFVSIQFLNGQSLWYKEKPLFIYRVDKNFKDFYKIIVKK